MAQVWTKILLVMIGLLGMTSSFGQDITLKKLYDGIEDMRLEVEQRNTRTQNQEYKEPFPNESVRLNQKIGLTLGIDCVKTLEPENIGKFSKIDLEKYTTANVSKVLRGSFTRPGAAQELDIFSTPCGMGADFGFAILEMNKFVSIYRGDGISFDGTKYLDSYPRDFFSVKDVNQNGTNEIMLLLRSRAKAPWDEMQAIYLLELGDTNPSSLGSFFVGGFPTAFGDGENQTITCSSRASKELQKSFPSNIIYVQKGKVPQFFAEGWEVNCDYLEKGVKARKVSSLTPIKPVPRAVGLTRLF
jgi:hypothetical protein